jgi:MFS family permease
VPRKARNRSPSPSASPIAAFNEVRCGAGSDSIAARSGQSSRWRAANASGDSDSTPDVRSTRIVGGRTEGVRQQRGLARAGDPADDDRATPARRAASSTAAIAARSVSRPASTQPTVPSGTGSVPEREPGEFPGVSDVPGRERGSRRTPTRGEEMSAHTTVDAHHGATTPDADEPRRPWTIFALMIAAQFMVILDVSVVNVALPSISESLHLSAADYQWTISAYVLMSGGLLLLGGRIADLLRRRGAFLTGVGLFTAASLASGLAQTPLTLILARAAQGAGAALLTPAALSIIMTAYAGRQRQSALAVWGTVGSLGIAAGVLFGGALTSALGWRAVFFINVPIGVAVVVARCAPSTRGTAHRRALRRLDVPGALTLVAGLLALVFGIEAIPFRRRDRAPHLDLPPPRGRPADRLRPARAACRRPLVPPSTWRIRRWSPRPSSWRRHGGRRRGDLPVVPVPAGRHRLLPRRRRTAVPAAGRAITLAAAGSVEGDRPPGARTLILGGLVVMAGGVLLLAANAGGTSYAADVLPGFLLVGAGVGPMFVAIAVAAMGDVPAERSGLASGLMMTGHEIGAALGVAALTAVAGDLATTSGLVDGYGRPSWSTAAALAGCSCSRSSPSPAGSQRSPPVTPPATRRPRRPRGHGAHGH